MASDISVDPRMHQSCLFYLSTMVPNSSMQYVHRQTAIH